ncbi:MAG: membrane protein insertion efficiency factor YidD [Hydrogenoanaerobacterium sp.]
MLKNALISIIRFYQKQISPGKPACCRYFPTCSSYALEAISRFGALRGGLLAFLRILRCNPLFKGGVDVVPQHFTLRRQK